MPTRTKKIINFPFFSDVAADLAESELFSKREQRWGVKATGLFGLDFPDICGKIVLVLNEGNVAVRKKEV